MTQLQAELELKRSALADSILSKLPGLSGASSSSSSSVDPQAASTSSRPRQANLGVGATPKQSTADGAPANGKARSAADLRLKGALTAKRKRWNDEETQAANRALAASNSDDEDVGRADTITATKKAKQSNTNGTSASSSAHPSKAAKKDPFAAKGIEAQKAAHNQPRIVIVDGKEIDLSKLSKTQRKKINKQIKAKEEQEANGTKQEAVQPTASPAKISSTPAAKANSPSKAQTISSDASGGGGKLTALQAQMLSKLSGSRFRTINEKLYTTQSDEAVRMIDASPAMFDEYHQGFREQVRSWPKNPLDRIVEMFDPSSSSANSGKKGKGKAHTGVNVSKFTKETESIFTPGALVVDLGAGEGGLAKKLVPKGAKVLCYDLVTTKDGWVRKQDTAAIGGLPLPGYFSEEDPLGVQSPPEGAAPGVADVAVFCLSLMGTNWIHMLLEAKRVLRTGGELIIAEVSSRFEGFDKFIQVVQMLGFGLEHKDASNTHFVLFEFVKLTDKEHSLAMTKSDTAVEGIDPRTMTLEELAEYGKTLLKPCIYKRR